MSPQAIRHSTATRLLRAGVDIKTLCRWLGYASVITTSVFAEVDRCRPVHSEALRGAGSHSLCTNITPCADAECIKYLEHDSGGQHASLAVDRVIGQEHGERDVLVRMRGTSAPNETVTECAMPHYHRTVCVNHNIR